MRICVGSIVYLKSNPEIHMVVSEKMYSSDYDEMMYRCVWFDTVRHLQIESFILPLLKLVTVEEVKR